MNIYPLGSGIAKKKKTNKTLKSNQAFICNYPIYGKYEGEKNIF